MAPSSVRCLTVCRRESSSVVNQPFPRECHLVQVGQQQRRQARHAGQAAQALVADGLRHRQPQPRHVRHALQRTQPRVCDLNRRILREHSRSALSGQQHVGLQCSSDTYAAAYKARGSLRAAVVASA